MSKFTYVHTYPPPDASEYAAEVSVEHYDIDNDFEFDVISGAILYQYGDNACIVITYEIFSASARLMEFTNILSDHNDEDDIRNVDKPPFPTSQVDGKVSMQDISEAC
jgi:hypothetical protein